MALAVTINYSFIDAKGKSSSTKVRVPSGFSVAQYTEFAIAMGQLMSNLSDGSITEISVGIPVDLSGATIRAAANNVADVAKKALFMMTGAIAGLFSKIFVPTFDESNTTSGSDSIDRADPDISAFVAILETGVNVGGINVGPVDMRENAITTVTDQREIFRKFG